MPATFDPSANAPIVQVTTFPFSIDDLIQTPRRMFSKEGKAQNKPGGVGTITKIDEG